MRKVVLSCWVSVDGVVVEDDSPLQAFLATSSDDDDEEQDRYALERLSSVGAHAMGAATYRAWSAFWPTADIPTAEPLNRIPKVVFTRGEEPVETGWGPVRVITGEAARTLPSLKAEDGGDIMVHGGTGFVHSLLRQGLFDELRLLVLPVAAGGGTRLFDGDGLQPLRLVRSRSFASGVQEVVWQPLPKT